MPMDLPRDHRPLLAWMLYFSVLLGALHCSFGHGQMVGFMLAGAEGSCAGAEHSGSMSHGDSEDSEGSADMPAFFNCPLCSFLALVDLALLFVLGNWLRPLPVWCRSLARRGKAPPRQHWPPANPRAP